MSEGKAKSKENLYIDRVVEDLLKGMSPERIYDDDLPLLFDPLIRKKEEAIRAGDTELVKEIQIVLKKIRYISSKVSPKIHKKTPLKVAKKGNLIDTSKGYENRDENQNRIKELLENDSLEIDKLLSLKKLIPLLKKDQEIFLNNKNLKQAQIIEDIIHDLYRKEMKYIERESYVLKNEKLGQLLVSAYDDLQACIDFWGEKFEEYNIQRKKAEESLKALHKAQIEHFELTWPKILPPNYRKLSKKVLSLRDQEKRLILSHRFTDAIPYQESADYLEEQEIQVQKENFENQFYRELIKLKKAQAKEIDVLGKRWNSKLVTLQRCKEKEILTLKQTVANLESKRPAKERGTIHEQPMMVAPPDSSKDRAELMRASKLYYQSYSMIPNAKRKKATKKNKYKKLRIL